MRRFLWIPALLGAASIYAVFDEAAGLRTWLRLDAELLEKRGRVAEIRREVISLRREVEALSHDPLAVERAIREDLEWARAGEVVVRLPSSGPRSNRIP